MKKAFAYLVATLLFNTAIAGLLNILMAGSSFSINLIYSHCIGLSVLAVSATLYHLLRQSIMRWVVLGAGLPASVALGMTLAFAFTGVGSWSNSPQTWLSLMIGLFFGLIGAIVFLLAERIGIEVQQRKLIQGESERREIEARLKMLQAQIEPHFLFNTLANVSSLIDGDPALAKQLLTRLNDWLRVALLRARSDQATLDDELDMLENYLQILKVRFGERLRWTIDVPANARLTAFPPMLLQPLVENAVRHGIEPKIGGGEIVIHATLDASALRIQVCDSGVGLVGEGGGTGLANVRERLTTLFGAAGKLTLENRPGGGVCAQLELPQ